MTQAYGEPDAVRTIGGLLKAAAQSYGDKPCIKYRQHGETITKTYTDLYRDSLACASFLSSKDLRGRHVALIGKTTYRYLVSMNAVLISGNTIVPLAYDMPADETLRLLDDCDAEVLIRDSDIRIDDEAIRGSKKLKLVLSPDVLTASSPSDMLTEPIDSPDQCAAIIYSSGTTGVKKGVMLTSEALVSNVYFKEMQFEGDHVALNVLPMHHIFSFSCDYLKNLKDGVTICLNSGIAALPEELLLFEPTVLRLVPSIVDSLLRRVRILRKRDPGLGAREAAEKVFGRKMRNIIVSGAAYSADNDAEFSEMGITIRQGYGMTEAGPRIAVPDGKTCAASGGRIISICNVRLQNGEIQVKSPSLMTGYYKKEAETHEMFTPDGWLRTGDLGRITPDRELLITGRLKNVIILGNGENVSPEEIERKYQKEPLISEIEVYEDGGKIAAEIYPDFAYAETTGIDDLWEALSDLIEQKNGEDVAAKEIDSFTLRSDPFPKTQSGKLKRRRWNT